MKQQQQQKPKTPEKELLEGRGKGAIKPVILESETGMWRCLVVNETQQHKAKERDLGLRCRFDRRQ